MSFTYPVPDLSPSSSGSTPRPGDETVERMLAGIKDLAPGIVARVVEIEAARRLPLDLVNALKSLGLFRMLVPASHGGMELDLPAALTVIRALARIDGSLAWTAMIGAGTAIFAPLLPRKIYDNIYRNGPDVIFAGSAQPTGIAALTADGWRVTGRWPFASGCLHADWIVGQCIMTDGGKPLPGMVEGSPMIRLCILPARDWQIEDTWYVTGLKGTGSHHVALNDVAVPAVNFIDLLGGAPCMPGPHYYAVPQLLPLLHGAVVLGMAEGAMEDLMEVAGSGRQRLYAPAPLRDSEAFHAELGRLEADLRAAQALWEAQVASHWRHAIAGTLKDEMLLIEGAQSGAWIAATCLHIANACFLQAGSVAIYESSPLQRRVRDLLTANQHAAVSQRHYVSAGSRLLGNAGPGLASRH